MRFPRFFSLFALGSLLFIAPSCQKDSDSDDAIVAYDREALQEGNLGHGCLKSDVEEHVASLLSQMTLEEKVSQMAGSGMDRITYSPGVERLGIPGLNLTDGPRGAKPGPSTTFPVGICRGATWDVYLEKRVGEAMGAETLAKTAHVLLAPTIEPVRHPRWGRTQETFSEDPLLLSRMGSAFISGVQQHVMASAKHFAANNIEDTRFEVNAVIDERTLREIYLPAFRIAVREAGVGTVMSAYNLVNGDYCGENEHLLRDILKGEWGFQGLVESDWFLGTRSTAKAANAGLDMEMPAPIYYGPALVDAVDRGEVSLETIDDAVGRVLRQKFCFGVDRQPKIDASVVESPEHVAVALESARKGIVLLKNDGDLLPLDSTAGEIALVGSLSSIPNLGDLGSSSLAPSETVTLLDGLKARHDRVLSVPTDTLGEADQTAIASADAAIVVVGNTWRDEGEFMPVNDPDTGDFVRSGDRISLSLTDAHEALIRETAEANPNTIVVLMGSGPFWMDGWLDRIQGLLTVWYPGMRGGQALAEILFGEVNPSGKLPMTFPRSNDQLPEFDNVSHEVALDAWHGYRLADREGYEPNFPFGFGLSYTDYEYSNLKLSRDSISEGDSVEVRVDVANTGQRAGEEIVQLYVSYEGSSVERPVKELKGFGRVPLEPGETKTIMLEVSARDLAYFDADANRWTVEPLDVTVHIGASSRDLRLSAGLEVR